VKYLNAHAIPYVLITNNTQIPSKEFFAYGKPSPNFYQKGLKTLQSIDNTLRFEDIEIIRDDVAGDLVGAKALGMRTSFVLSGKYPNADIVHKLQPHEKPDSIYTHIAEILETLK